MSASIHRRANITEGLECSEIIYATGPVLNHHVTW